MSGLELVSLAYAGVFLALGMVALLRARQADIPAVVSALAWWFRRGDSSLTRASGSTGRTLNGLHGCPAKAVNPGTAVCCSRGRTREPSEAATLIEAKGGRPQRPTSASSR